MPLPVGVAAFKIQADFTGTAFGGTPTWTDITSYVMTSPQEDGSAEVDLSWGRQDWFSDVTPSAFSFTLRNIDGRFTPGRALLADGVTTNPYYPHVNYRTRFQIIETIASVPISMADGYATDWTQIPRNGTYSTVEVNCVDIYSRMGVSSELRGLLLEEILLDDPSCLYALQEAEGSASFGDLTGNLLPLVVKNSKYGAGVVDAGQTPTAGLISATVVDVENASYATVTNSNAPGSWLSTTTPDLSALTSYTFEMWVQTPSTLPQSTSSLAPQIMSITPPSIQALGYVLYLGLTDGTANFSPDAVGGVRAHSTASICDGNVHHLVGVVTPVGHTLYVDSVPFVGTGTLPAGGPPPAAMNLGMGTLGGPSGPFDGAYAYVAIYPTALSSTRIQAHFNAGNNAFLGERTDLHVARLLSYRTNTGSSLDVGFGNVGQEDITGETLATALLDTSTAEGGTLYANGQGQIVMRSRGHNFNPTPVITLDAAQGHVDIPTQPREDIQNAVNDITVSRSGGADQTVTNQASIDQIGDLSQSFTANVDTDQHALDLANWLLAVGCQDQLGIPALTVNLYPLLARGNTAIAAAVLALQPLDCVTLINLPGVMPASTMTVQVQGGTYARTSESFAVTLTCTVVPPVVAVWDVTTWDSSPVWSY